ncbi:MAG: indole-3-glycerol phosphate synthase TrpC [Desulfobulbaceae bacterium]|jgi:indole-3-glycerol phosphate synthase|nr:indole-3-glycerol phosphate synthase TrpC [Desulfobulbaceae bacterium]
MILDTIVARKKEEVARLRQSGIVLPQEFAGKALPPPRPFRQALLEVQGVAIIAEVKKASPSKGLICADFDAVRIARNYQRLGAQAVSVLTDRDFFQGSPLYLMQAREAVSLPVLRKDFIIDSIQIDEAKAIGADAILLIVAILDDRQLRDFRQQAEALGMDTLIEAHDEDEVQRALAAGGQLIGINNRNLRDFSVDIATTFRLKRLIPESVAVVSESGLKTPDDMRRLAEARISAALIGESLVRDGGDLLRRMRRASIATNAPAEA